MRLRPIRRCRPRGHLAPYDVFGFHLFCTYCGATETAVLIEDGITPFRLSAEQRREISDGLGTLHRNSIFPALEISVRRYQLQVRWWAARPAKEVRRDGQRLLAAVGTIRRYLPLDRLESIWFADDAEQTAIEKASLVRFAFDMLEQMGKRDVAADWPRNEDTLQWLRRELEGGVFRALLLHGIPLGGIRASRVLAVALEGALGVRPADPQRTLAHARSNALDPRFRPVLQLPTMRKL